MVVVVGTVVGGGTVSDEPTGSLPQPVITAVAAKVMASDPNRGQVMRVSLQVAAHRLAGGRCAPTRRCTGAQQ